MCVSRSWLLRTDATSSNEMNQQKMLGTFTLLLSLTAPAQAQLGNAPPSQTYIPIAAIHSLLQRGGERVTVRATVTRNGTPLYIEDSSEGAAVEIVPPQDLKIGDQLVVSGWPDETDRGLVFRNASIRLLWPGIPVVPLAVTADQAALGKFANSLIEVEGRFLDDGLNDRQNWLKIESGNQMFLAHFDSTKASLLLPHLDRGSLLRLRGICSVRPEDTHYVGGFALLLRSAEDIDVVSGAPWWSPRHLFELGIVLLALVWAAHAARLETVRARFRAIMEERARVGHELHDTLAQGFAGVAFQIQAAKNNVGAGETVLERHLDLALDMVRHSHSEAHRSIIMLRPQSLNENANLEQALRNSILRMTEGCAIHADFGVNGAQNGLPLFIQDALYRVAQESIANALRHGHPRHLQVILDYDPQAVILRVMDDGTGFDPSTLDGSGFGLSGMKQRIRALHGTLIVTSQRGAGTQVRAEVPRRSVNFSRFRSAVNIYWDNCRVRWRLRGSS
jgi:signal transduction histidine kinase